MRAVNLGNTINTRFDEESPFIHVNNRNLFFASNGLPGFGGYDIYMSERSASGWQQPANLGAPLNDFEDQFSFVVASDGGTALYSREEAGMKSKIYQTSVPKAFQIKSKGNVVKGTVIDDQTKKPIESEVELFDLQTNQRISVYASDSINGNYLIVVPGKSEYAIHVSEPGYLFYSLHFNYEVKDQDQPLVINIALQPIKKNAVAILNNIFFESNKHDVTAKSIPELEEVVKFLTANPTTKVEISGHTDNVGDESYNQLLSQKRAQSVVDYFLGKGIAQERLTKVGYGSKSPIRPNDTEEHRQANRRIEFKIL
jgi:outer membrane protein OmpA-like peptidoglycan-associated protein